jgi:hypothetical protein
MKTVAACAASILALTLALPLSAAADSTRWIHVRVHDEGEDGARVDIQVPLAMVSSLLPSIKKKIEIHEGRIDLGNDEMTLDEMRGYWAAVKASRDGNYVTVRDGSDTVRIAKRGGVVHVDVSADRGSERVKLRLPAPLVDAVLGKDDTLDVGELVKALSGVPNGEIIAVDDDDSRVRIWIDDKPQPADEDTP